VKLRKYLSLLTVILILSLVFSSTAFAATKSAGPWNASTSVMWDDEWFLVSWTFNYKADYTDSGSLRTVKDHYSGGCIMPQPFVFNIINYLEYYKGSSLVKTVNFNTHLSAMCSSPKSPYLYGKYNDSVTYSLTGDIFKTRVWSVYSSGATTNSPTYRSADVSW